MATIKNQSASVKSPLPQFAVEVELDVAVAEADGDLIEFRVPVASDDAEAGIRHFRHRLHGNAVEELELAYKERS